MKIHYLIAISALITGVPMAGCKGGRSTQDASNETGAAHPATAARSQNSHGKAISTNNQNQDTKYGILDGDEFPIDPGFAMNSDRINADQRAALRQNPPEGYHVTIHQNPRFINRKDGEIEWRTTGLEPSSNLAAFMRSLGGAGGIPAGFHPDDDVLLSPSRNRVLIGSSSLDARKVFDLRGDGRELERGSRVLSVTFDDKWRWFIDWKCFLTESLIVGMSITDDEIESYPEQHRLYTYDIDSMTLTRIRLPGEIQPKGFEYFQIEAVSAGALLLRLGYEEGRKDDLFTLYLYDQKNNE